MLLVGNRFAMYVTRKWIVRGVSVLAVLSIAWAGFALWQVVLIGTAYKAKVLCSGIFVSKRSPESILTEDLAVDDLAVLRYLDTGIDRKSPSVTARFFGVAKRIAVYRPQLGCTLAIGASKGQLQSQAQPSPVQFQSKLHNRVWPEGERVDTNVQSPEVNTAQLGHALDWAFSEPDAEHLRRTRAVVVVYEGRIIAERYAAGFSHNTPLIGWSMTKSVVNALIGVLAQEGKLSLDDRALLPQWREPDDPRSNITLDQLLRMSSGLAFSEDQTNPLGDLIFMLLGTGDVGAYAAAKHLEAEPGTTWQYSSGTTNILTRILRDAVGGTDSEYFLFPRRALFDRIGMSSAAIEPDASGTFVGSSFMYATARDWARFGLLYLWDGMWMGKRVLPEGWVQYSRTPTAGAPGAVYGAHFWLSIPEHYTSQIDGVSTLPGDAFHAAGHEGQFVTVIPSRRLVVVRLGLSRLPYAWDQESFILRIIEAVRG